MGMMINNAFEDTESCALPIWFTPSDKDVVCGWARQYQGHAGNERFRKLVQYSAPFYLAATTKLQKTQVIAAVVDKVRRDSPQGGFVKLNVTTGRWYEIGDDRARDKVGHAIRRFLDYKPHRESVTSKKSSAKGTPEKVRMGGRSTSSAGDNQAAMASFVQLPTFDNFALDDTKPVGRDIYAIKKGEAIGTTNNDDAFIFPQKAAAGAQSCADHGTHQRRGDHQSTLNDKVVLLGPSQDVIRPTNLEDDTKVKASVAADSSSLHFPARRGQSMIVERLEETKGGGNKEAFSVSWTKSQVERGGGRGESFQQGQSSLNCYGYEDFVSNYGVELLPVEVARTQQVTTVGGAGREGKCFLPNNNTSRVTTTPTATTQDQGTAVGFCTNALYFGGSMGVGSHSTLVAPHSHDHQLNTIPTFPLSSTPGMPSASSSSSTREAERPSLLENSMVLGDIFLQQQEQQQQDVLMAMLGRFEHDGQALIQELTRLRDHSSRLWNSSYTLNKVEDQQSDAPPPPSDPWP